MYNLKIRTVISTYSSFSYSQVWINIHSERKGDKYSSSMSLNILAKTCHQLWKASIAITDYRTKEIITKPRATLSKHNKYAVISRLLDLSAIVICYQVTDNALWELFSYLLSPSPPFWYCQGIGKWVLSDIDNFTYICLHENEFFRPLTLTGQKYGRLITV